MKVELRGITKRFPGVVANKDVDLVVDSGEVLALLGENGAGKSTLMNILFGLYTADAGEIRINDQPVTFTSPADAIAAGIGMVHQHFMLVPVFTVAENILLGVEETKRFGLLEQRRARSRIEAISDEYGLHVDPDALVEDLPVGVQQRVEILKALYRKADCLILDEPTAVLTPSEIDDLMGIIETFKAAGHSVIFISHKLKEVMSIADRITVLRGGQVVGTTTPRDTNEGELAGMMVGREVKFEVDKARAAPGAAVLAVKDLQVVDDLGHRVVDGVSFDVRAGEILAIAGVQGNGQSELIEAIAGMRRAAAGSVHLADDVMTGRSPAKLFAAGLAHIPEDRQRDGLVAPFPVSENLVLNSYKRAPFAKGWKIDRPAIAKNAERLIDEFDIRTPSPDVPVSNLSGGNQQKVIVAREFTHAGRLLIASQPTRGLDVGSIQYIHGRIVGKRDDGTAVLLVSSELDEIMSLADRIAVMYRGQIVGILDRDEATREKVGLLMAGHTSAPAASGPETGGGEAATE